MYGMSYGLGAGRLPILVTREPPIRDLPRRQGKTLTEAVEPKQLEHLPILGGFNTRTTVCWLFLEAPCSFGRVDVRVPLLLEARESF